jgi:hypothetical protein
MGGSKLPPRSGKALGSLPQSKAGFACNGELRRRSPGLGQQSCRLVASADIQVGRMRIAVSARSQGNRPAAHPGLAQKPLQFGVTT